MRILKKTVENMEWNREEVKEDGKLGGRTE
jgi:hypothetical protein